MSAGRVVRSSVVVALVVAVLAGVVPARRPVVAAPGARLSWSPCYKSLSAELGGPAYECATAAVPLDYDQPKGPAIQLAVVRIPARDPAHRIGSIFLNPGGPGGSGVDFALFFGPSAEFLWGADVRDRFDLVGFDPRGVGRSTALRCFGNLRQSTAAFAPFAFPLTPQEEAIVAAGDGLLADQCAQRGNKVAEHMSTANVARDLDQLRAAVGDAGLNFVGLSYGSYLGTTYANMFPDRVRAVVVDGVLDPIAWANVEGTIPFSTRLRSDAGAQTTLQRFFELCDAAGTRCAFAPTRPPDSTRSPTTFAPRRCRSATQTPASNSSSATRTSSASRSAPSMTHSRSRRSPSCSPHSKRARRARSTPPSGLAATNGLITKRGFPHYPNFVEAFPGVACEDGNNPTDYAVWSQQGAQADTTFGYFGRIWTWASSACAQWPLATTPIATSDRSPHHRQPRPGHRKPLRPRHPLPGRCHRPRPPPELRPADRGRPRPHVARDQPLRRRAAPAPTSAIPPPRQPSTARRAHPSSTPSTSGKTPPPQRSGNKPATTSFR